MTTNEGMWDRSVRVVLGVAVLAILFALGHPGWALLGLLPLLTGLMGFCPAYRLFGFSTLRRSKGDTPAAA